MALDCVNLVSVVLLRTIRQYDIMLSALILSVVTLRVFILSTIMLSNVKMMCVIRLYVNMLSVVLLNVIRQHVIMQIPAYCNYAESFILSINMLSNVMLRVCH